MKFYKITYGGAGLRDQTEQTVDWATTQAAARRIARENDYGDYESRIETVEIEPNKEGILNFLRENVWRWQPGD